MIFQIDFLPNSESSHIDHRQKDQGIKILLRLNVAYQLCLYKENLKVKSKRIYDRSVNSCTITFHVLDLQIKFGESLLQICYKQLGQICGTVIWIKL